jgi:transcriptional regulator with XRE-family HTH domain
MAKRLNAEGVDFGARLKALRKAAGFTQEELAQEIGVSRRMIAYYEGETEYPPTALLPKIAQALKISADELLGIAPVKKSSKPANSRLQRRLQQIETLAPNEKRQVLQVLDAFIERGKLKKAASR